MGHHQGVRFFVRRLAGAAVLLWLVLTITFALLHAAPGDAAALLVPPSASAADASRLRAELGLDAPLVVQYARWLGGTLRGDFGESFALHRPVIDVIGDSLPISLTLGGVSLLLTFAIGVAIGTLQAARRGRATD